MGEADASSGSKGGPRSNAYCSSAESPIATRDPSWKVQARFTSAADVSSCASRSSTPSANGGQSTRSVIRGWMDRLLFAIPGIVEAEALVLAIGIGIAAQPEPAIIGSIAADRINHQSCPVSLPAHRAV